MEAPNSKTVSFRCSLAGMVSKEAPDLLQDGQFRYLSNVVSNQEGSLSSRTGVKQVGQLGSGLPTCYHIRKLVTTPGEDPVTPATNPRYLGLLTSGGARNIYRTRNYASLDNGGSPVVTGADASANAHWEMADYAAGNSSAPWAYFACPNGMFKDSGLNPSTGTLPQWGIQAATGSCLAAVITTSVGITTMDASLSTWGGVVVTIASDAGVSDNDNVVMSGVTGVTFATTDGRTDPNDASGYAVRIGVPDSSYNIVNDTKQFRLFDKNGQAVQMTGTYPGSGGSVIGVPMPGNLDGGAQSSPNNTQPYDWCMVYEEAATGDYGNPSQLMSSVGSATVVDTGVTYSCQQFSVHGGQAKVIIWATSDSRIGFIRVYRRGGTLSDEVGRLVARIPMPPTFPASGWTASGGQHYYILTDNIADADLVYNEQWTTDNYPPIVSTPPTPITTTASGAISSGWQTVSLTGSSPFAKVVTGNLVHIYDSAGSNEDVYAYSVASSSFVAFFQFSHASGVSIEVAAIYGQACNLTVTSESNGAILVAGDPNNPHTLYKSKNGYPQAFPIGTDAAGAVTSVSVGTPSNGIVNMVECRGQIFCMNVSGCFEVAVLQGSLTAPAQASDKGLRGQSAWCRTDTEDVWWLADDGVYSWNGSFQRKRSEAIDTIFHGQSFNGAPPIDMTKTAACRMAYRRGIIRLLYVDITGAYRELICEPMYQDRWTPINQEIPNTPENPNTALFTEPDTQSLIVASSTTGGATFGISDTVVVSGGTNFTSDWWTGSPSSDGTAIPWDIRLPWFDMGNPALMKMFEEVWLDIDPQLYGTTYSHTPTITVELLLNNSDTAVDTFTIAIPTGKTTLTGRQLVSLLPNLQNTSGSIYQSYGREATSISFHLSGTAYPAQMTLYRVIFRYQETGEISAGAATDWITLGNQHDVRLYQMKVVFDTAGTDRHLVLETRGGRDGKTAGSAQIFNLSSPTDLGSGRCFKVFPLADQTIAKLARVRPYASATISGNSQSSVDLWRVLDVTFPDAEQYPADLVNVTPWDNGGYEYLKYANQVTFEVNTNNVAVTVQLQADGANIGASFTLQSTESDRQRNITLPPGLSGYRWRAFVDLTQSAISSGAGMFQLFHIGWKFQQADKGEVGHSFDWDDLGHPYDKMLLNATIEYDTTLGGPITLQMDTLSGLGGTTISTNVARFTLGTGRGKTNFPLPADTVVKMVRLYPAGSVPTGYKQWKYEFDKVPYPADFVRVTPWKDASAPVDKEPSWLWIDADTAGIAATIQLQNENGTVLTVSHAGTSNNRKKNYAIPVDTHAKMWRLVAAEGGGGRFQLFAWGFERWQAFDQASPIDPPEIILATPWSDLGYPFQKLARSLSLVINTGGVACSVALQTSEGGTVTTVSTTTTYTSRSATITIPANLSGTLWRLVFTPGVNGLAQLWNWGIDTVKLPAALTTWSSYGQGFGYKGFKFTKDLWLDYICASAITVTLTSDTGTLSIALPSHSTRGVERYLLPSVWGSGLDKSKLYSITIATNDTTKPFMMFADMSGLEWIACGADRHAAYNQTTLSEMMPIAA